QDLLKDFGTGINRTSILIARNNWKVSEEELRNTTIQRLFEVERAYWDLYFAVADLGVSEMHLERARKLVKQAEALEEVGLSPAIDVTWAETMAAAQETAILQAQNRARKLRHRLLRVLGILDVERVGADFELADSPATEPVKASLAQAVRIAKQARPDYAQAELAIGNSELQRRFTKNQRLPTLQLFGEYGFAGMDDSLGDSVDVLDDGDFGSWQLGLRFAVPLPNRTARSEYRAAQLQYQQARVRLDALTETITREVADALADLEAAEKRIETTDRARRLAESLLSAEDMSYSLGRSDSLDVLDAQAALAAAERNEVRARTDYATALTNLYKVQGNLLEQKGIALKPPQSP
ncbi:MAG: TolC family protein, partial [Candidatus Brocadiae bacterium]|nr:TolC family protein [Candidatus Brocadiia bacterium]